MTKKSSGVDSLVLNSSQLAALPYQEFAKQAENQSAAGANKPTKPPKLPAVTEI